MAVLNIKTIKILGKSINGFTVVGKPSLSLNLGSNGLASDTNEELITFATSREEGLVLPPECTV